MGEEDCHLMTFDTRGSTLTDHGPILYQDKSTGRMCAPAYVNSIAVAENGSVYSLGRVRKAVGADELQADLFIIPGSQIAV